MNHIDVLVISPFRRPDFRHAVSPSHPFEEPLDSPPFVAAAASEGAGFSTAVLALQNVFSGFDQQSDLDELHAIVGGFDPQLVLFSSDHFIASRSTATAYGIELAAGLLRRDGDPLIGVTGRLATTAGISLLHTVPELDFVVIGEAEQVLGDVITVALSKGPAGLAEHPNVLTRDDAVAPQPAFIAVPDDLPVPAFHLAAPSVQLLLDRRALQSETVSFSLRTSYGCKFRCRFCAGVPHWTDYRTKSASRIAAEIDHLYQSLPGVARLSFLEDEIATRHATHVRDLARVLHQRHIRLDGVYTHATLLSDEVANLLAPVVDRVFLGLDNPHDGALREMRKGQSLSTVLTAARRARSAGLGVHLEWIIGSPEDTVDTLITSLHGIFSLLLTGAVDSINTYVYCPHPGTEYAMNAQEHGLKVHSTFDMLESGGYPASSTPRLSRNQAFAAYLMSQVLIAEAADARRQLGPGRLPRPPVRAELERLFAQIGASQ